MSRRYELDMVWRTVERDLPQLAGQVTEAMGSIAEN